MFGSGDIFFGSHWNIYAAIERISIHFSDWSSGRLFSLSNTLFYDNTPAELMTFPSAECSVHTISKMASTTGKSTL